jgi:hypothetical protein
MGSDSYADACRASYRVLSALVGEERVGGYSDRYASRDLVASINFIGMDARPREVFSLALLLAATAFGALAATGMAALVLWPMDGAAAAVLVLCMGIVPLLVFVYVSEYPKRRAAYMKVHSLGDVPEVISYIVMSMKLNPNIERAFRFAATNSRRQLAKDVRKLMWDLQMRAYDSLDDALDSFANGWIYGEHFKRSMFLIKSATCEREEAMRTIALNRALDVVLKGTKGLMQEFSSSLHAPTLILYSIFVMVPLALVAMLPAAAVVGLKVNALEMALLYDILFPMATLLYAHSILMKRPAAFAPPEIPDDHPMLSGPRWTWALLAAGCGLAAASLYVIVPLGLLPISNTIFIVWGMTAAISVYCAGVYAPYKRIRDEIASMEADFADSLFILGRRMSEGKSPEDGFAYTAGMVSGSAIGRAYAKAAFNIRCLRSTLYEAVLGEYGAFSDVYSDRIRATIGMLVESSVRSGEVAGSSVVRLADHLKELQEIEDEIRKMLFTMTSMLRTTCIVFAPFIGGITLALSQSVADVLDTTVSSLNDMPESARAYFPMMPEFGAPLVSPGAFVLIVGIYLMLLVIILMRFVDGIEHGDDRYELMYGIGRTLPLSMAVFTATTMMANVAFEGML